MTDRNQLRSALLDYLATIARPGSSMDAINDSDNLIDIGVIDSLAMIHIILYLEQDHGANLAASGIDPGQLMTLDGILSAISAST